MLNSRSLVWLTIACSIIIISICGTACYLAVQQQGVAADALSRSQGTARALQHLLNVLRDAETGQRGYLLTGRIEYLGPYQQALTEARSAIAQVRQLAPATPALQENLPALEKLAHDKLDELAQTVALLGQGQREAALAVVETDEGKKSMDAARALIGALVSDQHKLQQIDVERLVSARHRTTDALIAMIALTMVVLLVLVLVFRLESRSVRMRERYLMTVLQSIGDAVVVTDTQSRVTLVNPVAEQLLGADSRSLVGRVLQDVFKIVNESTRAPVEDPVRKVLKTGVTCGLANHTLLIRPDGSEVPIEDSAAPVASEGGDIEGVVLIFRDASAARASETQLREADRRKDQFLAILAHELRNPLAPIRNASLVAKAFAATEEQRRWSHDVIDRQIGHMARLLDDLLDVSRITRGTIEVRKTSVELGPILSVAVETARPAMDSRSHTLKVESTPAPIVVQGDALRLAQVFANVLNNAAKYTPPGGEIRLTTALDGETAEIRVSDNGVGLAQESLSSVFEMFVRVGHAVERVDGGLGIGLALAKGLVELHGGTIQAFSQGLGKGSEFVVRLPAGVVSSERSKSTVVDSLRNTRPLKVLVADDNRDSADSLGLILASEGHEILVAYDGKQALQLIEDQGPDLAFVDIGMPILTGYQLAEAIQRSPKRRGLRLVAVTGWGQPQDQEKALAAGFDEHQVKPLETDEVFRICQEVATRKYVT